MTAIRRKQRSLQTVMLPLESAAAITECWAHSACLWAMMKPLMTKVDEHRSMAMTFLRG